MPHLDTHQVLYLSIALAVAVVSCVRALTTQDNTIPWLNPSKRPQILGRDPAHLKAFLTGARGLLERARQQFAGKPFRVAAEYGPVTVLPATMVNEIRNKPGLNFMRAVARDLHSYLPGFEPFAAGECTDGQVQTVIRKQLTKHLNKVSKPLSEEANFVTELSYGTSTEWKEHVLHTGALDIVARLSSRVFLGPEVARDETLLSITKSYTVQGFSAAEMLRSYSPWWRRVANYFLPECRLLRKQLASARDIITPVFDKRRADRQMAVSEGRPVPVFDDALDWLEAESHGKAYDVVKSQLFLSSVAIHTTTDLLMETMINIAKHPDLFSDLRKEIVDVLKVEGWKKTALFNLKLLDSTIKESQRLRPILMTTMMRIATSDVPLSNGMTIRKGERIAVDTSQMRDPAIYPDPDSYDGRRFVRMRDMAGQENQAHLVSTGPASLGFGHGLHACPGRFFAANEIKVALCHLIMKYDWKLAPGCEPKASENGFSMAADMTTRVMMRRREPELDIDAV
ncbi:hypothetical protein ACHAQH_000888 [Verticillium albo-atrum]